MRHDVHPLPAARLARTALFVSAVGFAITASASTAAYAQAGADTTGGADKAAPAPVAGEAAGTTPDSAGGAAGAKGPKINGADSAIVNARLDGVLIIKQCDGKELTLPFSRTERIVIKRGDGGQSPPPPPPTESKKDEPCQRN